MVMLLYFFTLEKSAPTFSLDTQSISKMWGQGNREEFTILTSPR